MGIGGVEQLGVPVGAGGEPATTDDVLLGGHDLDRGAAFVRVHADHDPRGLLVVHRSAPLLVPTLVVSSWEGTATYGWAYPS